MWQQSRYALEFFSDSGIPFWDMSNDNDRVSSGWCLVQSNEDIIVVYLPNGGTTTIDLATSTTYSVKWYDPRNGGLLQDGSETSLLGGNNIPLGSAPNNDNQDWVILLEQSISPPSAPSTSAPTPTAPSPVPPTQSPPTPSPPTAVGSVTGFTLIDTNTDTPIMTLNENDVIDLSVTGSQLSIRADTSGTIGSVSFGLDNNDSFRTENVAPYALGGDQNSDYSAVSQIVQTGTHTVSATPYSGSSKSGVVGNTASISFSVVNIA